MIYFFVGLVAFLCFSLVPLDSLDVLRTFFLGISVLPYQPVTLGSRISRSLSLIPFFLVTKQCLNITISVYIYMYMYISVYLSTNQTVGVSLILLRDDDRC